MNPTGRTISAELLEQIFKRCEKLGIFVVLDECFCEFLENPETARANIDRMKKFPNLFLLRAFTKIHAMPGLRLGYGFCSDKKLLDKMEQMRQPWSVSTAAQEAGAAALEEQTGWRKPGDMWQASADGWSGRWSGLDLLYSVGSEFYDVSRE